MMDSYTYCMYLIFHAYVQCLHEFMLASDFFHEPFLPKMPT